MIDEIISQLQKSQPLYINTSFNSNIQAWLTTELLPRLTDKTGALLVAETNKQAEDLEYLLKFWQNFKKNSLPVRLFSLHTSACLSAWLEQIPQIVILNSEDVSSSIIPAKILQSKILSLTLNQSIKPQELTAWLQANGFTRDEQVWQAGQYSQRGEIIDIRLPHLPEIQRIIFVHNKIETLLQLEKFSLKNQKKIKKINIYPLKYPNNQTGSLTDYLNEKLLITSSAPASSLNKKADIIWDKVENKANFDLGIESIPNFSQSGINLNKWLKSKKITLLYAPQETQEYMPSFTRFFSSSPLAKSFYSDFFNIAFINKSQLPLEKEKTSISSQFKSATFRPGEYVTHLDHGIGLFAGITTREIERKKRDFYELHYADNDKLFVPIELGEKIEKYVGLSRPTLHRLSGSSWQQAKEKIKEDSWQLAQQLIAQEAKRSQIKNTQPLENFEEEKSLATDFPFTETADQLRAFEDIKRDLHSGQIMDRLICGDVGFGKTEIALRTTFKFILNKYQVALLCPTTVLAQQHFDTFSQRLEKYGINMALLSRFQTPKEQADIIAKAKNGQLDLIIGTHRLLSADMGWHNLGLLIIDEEQKFGVQHKEKLKQARWLLHILTLTATPIPRTLYFSLTNLRSISLIAEPPRQRKPIITTVSPTNLDKIKKWIKFEIQRQGQIYYLHNRVETIELKAAQLKKILPNLHLAIAHGQMPSQQLAETMHKFDQGKIDLLLCSTIIENGLDLPNVNTMIIENAPRFGLAQLYQLRGRIGRGQRQAYAYLLYNSEKLSLAAKKRLQALLRAQELGAGFTLAKQDLEIRGIGDLLGQKQHGHVRTVGLSLYLRLLEQSVNEQQGEKPGQLDPDCRIELPLTYNIPDKMIKGQEQKFQLYQKLTSFSDEKKLYEYAQEKFQKKSWSKEFSNLLKILSLQILGKKSHLNFISTTTKKKQMYCQLFFYQSPPQIPEEILKIAPWQEKKNTWVVEMEKLGENLLDNLHKCLTILANKDWP